MGGTTSYLSALGDTDFSIDKFKVEPDLSYRRSVINRCHQEIADRIN